MKKTILIVSIMTLTMQLHSEKLQFQKAYYPPEILEVPTIGMPIRTLEIPTIRMPIGNQIVKKVATFKGKLYAKKIRKRLKNINTHNTRILKGGHRYSFSLNIQLPKRKATFRKSNLKDKRNSVKVPTIELFCHTKLPYSRNKDIPRIDEGRSYIFETFKLNQKEYNGTFSLFRFQEEIKDSATDLITSYVAKSEALSCRISIKENKGNPSEYDYVKYTLSFFDYGKEVLK